MRQLWILVRAAARMLARSKDAVRMAVITPVITVAVFAVMSDLRVAYDGGSVDFVDFAVPGLAAFYIVHFIQDLMVATAAHYRASGILRRIAVAPVTGAMFIGAHVLAYLFVGLWVGAATLGLGAALGANVNWDADLLWLVPIAALIALTALSLSFAIAGVMRSTQGANSLSLISMLPMMFFGGVYFPTEGFPAGVEDIAHIAVPFAALIDAFREISLGHTGIDGVGGELLIGVGWLAVAFLLAVRTYRFLEERRGAGKQQAVSAEPVVGC